MKNALNVQVGVGFLIPSAPGLNPTTELFTATDLGGGEKVENLFL